MNRFISKLLFLLKSEKSKHAAVNEAFLVGSGEEQPEPPLLEKTRLLIAAHFKFTVTILIAIAAVVVAWYKK
ncbi:MAG: hypothetical protein HY850_12070 [Betaproteobacteria bacterium]|nr:hypothetical protein [Betaproteobacteria bacterium]